MTTTQGDLRERCIDNAITFVAEGLTRFSGIWNGIHSGMLGNPYSVQSKTRIERDLRPVVAPLTDLVAWVKGVVGEPGVTVTHLVVNPAACAGISAMRLAPEGERYSIRARRRNRGRFKAGVRKVGRPS